MIRFFAKSIAIVRIRVVCWTHCVCQLTVYRSIFIRCLIITYCFLSLQHVVCTQTTWLCWSHSALQSSNRTTLSVIIHVLIELFLVRSVEMAHSLASHQVKMRLNAVSGMFVLCNNGQSERMRWHVDRVRAIGLYAYSWLVGWLVQA